ncbi:MAG: hypothetical protein M3P18_26560, partial [Actinomycetota bacterium]|nr:hypothetical protein [Actinomycetota bacterium]
GQDLGLAVDFELGDELWQLRETPNVSWDTLPNVRTFAQMRQDIPRSFPWTLAHTWLTLAVVAVLALLIGGIIAGHA